MYPIRKLCITLGSISKEEPYDLGFLSRSRFKAHTIVEDERWMRDHERYLEVDERSVVYRCFAIRKMIRRNHVKHSFLFPNHIDT
jgi:hypothetical protein